ncbi:hypothetical protein V2A60_000225 [Cordyceps javanica]|uniref:Integral membrane protein n=1 Tax=Cordyceps javanica TaxID=43265 RepID=A0A545V5Z6_9HYPO|nr:integral membrane protein [Cordyceps javanica]TQW08384.1 integral membrane protein [Cordyceps javanica]
MAQHPLQRAQSPGQGFSLLWHLVGIASFASSYRFLLQWKTPVSESYGWHLQFLTIIALTLSFFTFVVAVVADVTRSATLFGIKNSLSIVATPLNVVVTTLYFGISAIDPELVVPPEFKIPLAVDLGFHFAPGLLLVFDYLVLSPPWTVGAPVVMGLSTSIAFGYWYWIELCYSKNGWYTYPIFALLNTPQRVLLFVFSAVLVTVASSSLKVVYAKLNGPAFAAEKKTN